MENAVKKVLIVEDEGSVNYAMSLKFDEIKKIDMIYAKDGEEGLRLALEKKPDLILLDIIMPKMNGIEMLKRLRQDERGKNIRVMVLSNLSDPIKEKEVRELGVDDYIIKADWNLKNIVKKVMSILEKQS